MLAVAMLVAVAATLAPAIRGARTSTVRALNDAARPPRRRPSLIAVSAALPVPLLLGLRLLARRPRRSVLTAASLAIAVAMAVTALTVRSDLHAQDRRPAPIGLFTQSAIGTRANHVLVLLSVVLVVLAALSTTFTAWATVLDTRRPTALARALGGTPAQVSAGLTTAQLVPALAAACVGVPAGLLLYQLAGGHLREAGPPVLALLRADVREAPVRDPRNLVEGRPLAADMTVTGDR